MRLGSSENRHQAQGVENEIDQNHADDVSWQVFGFETVIVQHFLAAPETLKCHVLFALDRCHVFPLDC